MKNTIVMVAVAMFATSAMASKSRLAALQNSTHLSDKSDVLSKPHAATQHGNFTIFEMGPTGGVTAGSENGTGGATPSSTLPSQPLQAVGGFVKQHGDAAYGAFLGHNQVWVNHLRPSVAGSSTLSASNHLSDENPLNLFYGAKAGDLAWGAGLGYSNSDKKTGGKQSATTLIGSAGTDMWDVNLTLGLTNTSSDGVVGSGETKFTGGTAYNLDGTYHLDGGNCVQVTLYSNKGKSETGTTANYDRSFTSNKVAYVNHSKVDGGEFYYGLGYQMVSDTNSTANSKIEVTTAPFVVGIEADANSWLALRASVTQNVLLSSSKTTTTGTAGDTVTVNNNTTVAAGAGIKWGKVDLDGTLAAASSATAGQVNGNSLLANAALTYKF